MNTNSLLKRLAKLERNNGNRMVTYIMRDGTRRSILRKRILPACVECIKGMVNQDTELLLNAVTCCDEGEGRLHEHLQMLGL